VISTASLSQLEPTALMQYISKMTCYQGLARQLFRKAALRRHIVKRSQCNNAHRTSQIVKCTAVNRSIFWST